MRVAALYLERWRGEEPQERSLADHGRSQRRWAGRGRAKGPELRGRPKFKRGVLRFFANREALVRKTARATAERSKAEAGAANQ